jgi:hypothetical protein
VNIKQPKQRANRLRDNVEAVLSVAPPEKHASPSQRIEASTLPDGFRKNLGIGNLLDETPKESKIMETTGDGRQNETIGEMLANGKEKRMIRVQCPTCKKTHQAPESILGKRVKCKDCGNVFLAELAVPTAPKRLTNPPQEEGIEFLGPAGAEATALKTPPNESSSSPTPTPWASGANHPDSITSREIPDAASMNPDDILAQYKKMPNGSGGAVGGKVQRGLAAIKDQVRAQKLRREVAGLQTAIEGQLEALGILMLQHRPGGIDITAEIGELSQVQANLSAKQSTLDALRKTKGSGPATKEVEQDVQSLRDRQREMMIGLGRKAESDKVDAPGAAGHYGALDTIYAALATKKAELESFGGQASQVSGLFAAGGWAAHAGTVVSLPVGLMLVIFFFLPWLDVKCQGQKVASASGFQLTIGKASIVNSDMGPSSEKDSSKEPSARPWFILGLLIPASVIAIAGMSLVGRIAPKRLGKYLIYAGLAGLLIMILALNVEYSKDSGKDMGIQTESTGILIASFVLYVLGVLCGFSNLFLPGLWGKASPISSDSTWRGPPL